MSTVSDGTKQNTKKLRFTLLASFFNYIHNSIDPDFQNPCHNSALRKLFRAGKPTQFKILEKDVVDEIIFRTQNPRNRLLLELMARGCMRVGEVLKLTPMDIEDRKVVIRDPKSGREAEVVFLPQKVIDRLQKYVRDNGIKQDARIFPFTYAAARLIVKNAGELVGIYLKPHDLRKHAATYASDPELRLKLFQRCCSGIRTCQLPRFIWAKSAMLKRYGGSITCMGNSGDGRVGVSGFGPAISKIEFQLLINK